MTENPTSQANLVVIHDVPRSIAHQKVSVERLLVAGIKKEVEALQAFLRLPIMRDVFEDDHDQRREYIQKLYKQPDLKDQLEKILGNRLRANHHAVARTCIELIHQVLEDERRVFARSTQNALERFDNPTITVSKEGHDELLPPIHYNDLAIEERINVTLERSDIVEEVLSLVVLADLEQRPAEQ